MIELPQPPPGPVWWIAWCWRRPYCVCHILAQQWVVARDLACSEIGCMQEDLTLKLVLNG